MHLDVNILGFVNFKIVNILPLLLFKRFCILYVCKKKLFNNNYLFLHSVIVILHNSGEFTSWKCSPWIPSILLFLLEKMKFARFSSIVTVLPDSRVSRVQYDTKKLFPWNNIQIDCRKHRFHLKLLFEG